MKKTCPHLVEIGLGSCFQGKRYQRDLRFFTTSASANEWNCKTPAVHRNAPATCFWVASRGGLIFLESPVSSLLWSWLGSVPSRRGASLQLAATAWMPTSAGSSGVHHLPGFHKFLRKRPSAGRFLVHAAASCQLRTCLQDCVRANAPPLSQEQPTPFFDDLR